MRLRMLHDGHARREREGLREWEQLAGEASDVTLALAYRPEFFGDPLNAWIQQVLRGESEWSVPERELIGAFAAHEHRCPFCAGAHGAVAALELGADRVRAALDDPEGSPMAGRVRAAFELVRLLVRDPAGLSAERIDRLRAEGVGEEGVEDAVNACAIFVLMARLALAFGFEGSPEGHRQEAEALSITGYSEWRAGEADPPAER
jgi:uncharacterized peroxidase-related enzyme